MKYEISSGGVVFKKFNNQLFILMLLDKNDNWTFPKGLVEDGELPENAAGREIGEEVGIYKIKIMATLSPVQYWYKFEGELIKKTVHYFLFEELEGEFPKPQNNEGIKEVKWFELEEAINIVGYRKTNVKLLEETRKILIPNYSN